MYISFQRNISLEVWRSSPCSQPITGLTLCSRRRQEGRKTDTRFRCPPTADTEIWCRFAWICSCLISEYLSRKHADVLRARTDAVCWRDKSRGVEGGRKQSSKCKRRQKLMMRTGLNRHRWWLWTRPWINAVDLHYIYPETHYNLPAQMISGLSIRVKK